MTDSLVLSSQIELLGGGQASTHPQCTGAYFRLGTGFDLSAPQITAEQVAGMLLDGEVVSGFRASNRAPTIPVVMYVPNTGDPVADRLTLAGARELLLQTTGQETWEMVWTREGADPLIFDCFSISSTVVHYSIRTEQALFSQVDVTFQALPYGRSDEPETLVFNAPAAVWPIPPSSVTLDDFTIAYSFITGDTSGFEGGTGGWTGAGNATLAQTGAQSHSGTKSLQMTAIAAANMQAASVVTGSIENSLPCKPGDTINAKAFSRAATTARSVNIGVDFYDSNDNPIGSTLRGSNVTNSNANFNANPVAAPTAPATSAWCRANLQVVAPAAGEVHYFDDVTLDRGPVYSSVDPTQWTRSSVAASGSFSAFWSRISHDNPIYDRTSLASWDITGRTKFTFWLGLSTTLNQWPVWHKGNVHFAITLYDTSGNSLAFGMKRRCAASALQTQPHWQLISAHIPQVTSGFDYTQVTRYVISAWNIWDSRARTGVLQTIGGVALQASAYLNLVQAVPSTTGTPGPRGAWYTLHGPVGTARAPLAVQCAPGPSSFSTVVEFTTPGSNAFTTGVGVTMINKAEAWGGGAGGAGGSNNNGGGSGGGAGEYSMEINIPVNASTSYPATVGAAGTGGSAGNPGTSGGDSFWSGQSGRQVRANGGNRGLSSKTWGGGKGGSGSTNYVHHDGGNGRQSNVNGEDGGHGGGGGGSGGPSAPGHDAGSWHGATAVFDGGPGGQGGGLPSDPGSPSSSGNVPSTGPGGGGGGGNDNSGGRAGAAGRAGKVRLSYGASGLLPLASLLVHSPGIHEPDAYNPLIPLGTGTDVPNGSTEYVVPDIGNLNARYDGTYTMYLVAGTWNNPSAARNLTVQLRQYPYTAGTATTLNVVRNGVVPNTDITNGFVDMGPVTLPLNQLSPGGLDSYFALTTTSSNTSDRFLDVLLISTQGSLVLVNVPGSSVWNNIWIDPPDADRNLGLILGSPADRDQASSLLQYVERFSGGPLMITPDHNNRLLVYSAQGAPALTATYGPQWWTERLS